MIIPSDSFMVRIFEIPSSQVSQLESKDTSEQQLPHFLHVIHLNRIISSSLHERREADYGTIDTDVGAGGLSNALPELLHDTNLGSVFELRNIDNADSGMRYITLSQFFLLILR